MSKVRIYELAKETGLPNKEVIRRLAELGVEAKSHSSTVEAPDAKRFRESLGKLAEERRKAEEERARKEAEAYDLAEVGKPASGAKARRVLPPHLRKQAEEAEQGAQPAEPARRFRPATQPYRPGESAGVSVGGDETPVDAPAPSEPAEGPAQAPAAEGPAQAPAAEQRPAEQPAAEAPAAEAEAPAAEEVGQEPAEPRTAAEAARAGVVRPAEQRREPAPTRPVEETVEAQGSEEPEGVPGVPRPGTPPRPGQPTRPPRRQPSQSAATGMPVQPKRRVETNLPQEGSGRRSIPPPVKPAPTPQPGGAPSRPSERPGSAPSRPAPGGGPGGPGGPPAGGRPGRGKKGKKGKKRELTPQEQFEQEQRPGRKAAGPLKAQTDGPVDVVPGVTVSELAKQIGVNPTDVVRVLFGLGEMVTVTQTLSQDLVELVAAEMDADVRFVTPEELEFGPEEEDDPDKLEPRAPVVTVMGHVDHGKTKLLDAIRQTDVTAGEAGGITQHIGAYQVSKNDRAVTFIDTPGHEAFTQMRARGASVTDVAILVVAADDGVMPQTVEAINHIKAADVPIIVAVNKVDKPTADPNRVRTMLTEHDLIAEEFGGETTMVDVSAITRDGLDDLLEMVLLQADIVELKANPDRKAAGAVIEAHLDRGRGAVATVLVQAGTLRIGDALVAGRADCKVRAMFDADGNHVREATPSQPVQVLGWNDVPDAGDEFRVVADERTAREIAGNRQSRMRRMELAEQRTSLSLEELSGAIAEGDLQTLNLIVKGDVAGSTEALADAVNKLELPEVKIRIVHKGVGAVNESDVGLAETSGAIIIAFNVRPDANARNAIEESGVDLRQYSVIYQAVEDIERAVKGMLAPEYEEVTLGRAEVREVFKVPRAGYVFGCYVTEGSLRRNAQVRVIRDGVVVGSDKVDSLKRFKDDVTEVATSYECGVGLDKFQDVKVGDELEAYERREVARV